MQDPKDLIEERLEEQGYPAPVPTGSRDIVPGNGRAVVPQFLTFASVINLASRSFRWAFDEALRDSWANALAMRRDPVIMDALRSRQLPTIQLDWHLEGDNPEDAEENEAIKELTEIIKQIPRFQEAKKQLLEAIFYGRYGVQFIYEWDWTKGYRRMVVREHWPVDGDKLIFKFSEQRVGVLVHSLFNPPHPSQLQISDRGKTYFFNPVEREQLVIHRFEPEDADFYEGVMAGQAMGVGLRSRLYWFWWLRNEVQAWLMDYLERVGAGGILIYWFEAGNPASEASARDAAANADRDQALVLPRAIGAEKQGPGVQQIEPSEAGSNLLKTLITEYFDSVIRNYVLGQTLTTRTGSTGMGSAVAEAHEETFQRLIRDDAFNLADTLTQDLVSVLQKYNRPNLRSKLRWVFDVSKPKPKEFLESAKLFWDMGGGVDEDQLRSIIGLSKPKPGATVLRKPPEEEFGDIPGFSSDTSHLETEPEPDDEIQPEYPLDGHTGQEPFPELSSGDMSQEVMRNAQKKKERYAESGEGDPEAEAEVKRRYGWVWTGKMDPTDPNGKRKFWKPTPPDAGGWRRQINPPGGGRSGAKTPTTSSQGLTTPQAKSGQQAKPRDKSYTPHHAVKEIQDLRAAGHVSEDHAKDLANRLSRLTVEQIHELKNRLGLHASGAKAILAQKIAERALAPNYTPDDAYKEIRQLRFAAPVTVDQAKALANKLHKHFSLKQYAELKENLGIAASGNKVNQAQRIVDKALAGVQEKPQATSLVPEPMPESGPVAEPTPQPEMSPASEAKPSDGALPVAEQSVKGFSLSDSLNPEARKAMAPVLSSLSENTSLGDEQKVYYAETAQKVLGRMNAKSLERFQAHNDKPPIFVANTRDLRDVLIAMASDRNKEKLLNAKGEIGGCYFNSKTPGKSQMIIDGDKSEETQAKLGKYNTKKAQQIYAHEFSHGIDGPVHEISDSQEWQDAWKEELAGGRLNRYAATLPSEGFAEIGRMLLTGEFPMANIRSHFPKCVAVWEKHGILPADVQ